MMASPALSRRKSGVTARGFCRVYYALAGISGRKKATNPLILLGLMAFSMFLYSVRWCPEPETQPIE